MGNKLRALLLEDVPEDAELVVAALRHAGFDPEWLRVDREAAFRDALEQGPDIVLCDFNLPGYGGFGALAAVRAHDHDIPVIMVTGTLGDEIAAECIRRGAYDYILKDHLSRLGPAVFQALERRRLIAERKLAAKELLESETALRRAQLMAGLTHVVTGPDGAFERWPETMPQMIGVDPADMIRSTREWLDIIHPEDRALFRAKAIEAGATHMRMDFEYRLRRADGIWLHVRQVMEPLEARTGPGDRVRWFNTIQDITAQKLAESRIRRLNRVYSVLSGINALIVRVKSREELFGEACRIAVDAGQFVMAWLGIVDRSAMRIVPIASAGVEAEFLEMIRDRFSLREDAPLGNTMSARAVREKRAFVSKDMPRDPGILFAEERSRRGIASMAILPLLIADEAVGVLALYASEAGYFDEDELKLLKELAGDISFAIDHIDRRERLDYLAYYDVLTGLANRSLFLERTAQFLRSAAGGGHRLALYLIDLERFQQVNDSLGHPAGDALLRQVAQWLTRRAGDVNLVARIGADQFAAVLPSVRHDGDVARLLEKTLDAFVEHPFPLDDSLLRIGFKAGIALFPDDGADADTLLKHAGAALKKAKASGERYLFYTQKMTEAMAGKMALEGQLRRALEHGEFVLHYQPKINIDGGKLTGAEALLRWDDPQSGLVLPGRIIATLEETGLIHPVGRWALHQAIADYLRWRDAGLAAVRIAVNVSPMQLRHRRFVDEIEQAISVDPDAAAGLELEITEGMIMEDVRHSIATLRAIRAMGVTVAIDDFGTGFSSLSYLSRLPVDTLKIDRSFVSDMTGGPDGWALVSTIINLANALKLNVVAEGVETEEQSRLLRLLKCNEMQGFLFSQPVPAKIFEDRFLRPAESP